MNKIIFTIVAILLLNFLPLIGRPELILHYKTIFLAIAAASLWLSQPAFSTQDTKSHQASDRSSVLVILIMSSLSVASAVTEWGYTDAHKSSSILMTSVGATLLLIGITIRIWAIQTLGRHFTATATLVNDHKLITDGPYRFVRHPSYLGAFMAIIGCPVFLNAPIAIVVAIIAMSIAYYIRITVEEAMLGSYFGAVYSEYKKTTKRLIPYIW
jgi:protein-S-isoprenylcysteine O-methyltransferase Ste14